MPELPEVETMVRGIRDVMTGRRLLELRACPCDCRPLTLSPSFNEMARRANGQTVTAVRRVAKRVVIDLSSRDSFIIEPRMTGLMLLADPPDREHLRLEWQMSGGGRTRQTTSVWFWDRRGLGVVRLCDPEELERRLGSDSLGKDALLLTESDWHAVCQRTTRPIKVALLDQKLVAGIGNLYASEILHQAGISPLRPASKVSALTSLQAPASRSVPISPPRLTTARSRSLKKFFCSRSLASIFRALRPKPGATRTPRPMGSK